MHLRRSASKRNDDDRILPLINVVFLLLIFFMLAGKLSAGDPFRVDPPASLSEGPATAKQIEILIGSDGQLALDDALVDETGLREGVERRLGESEGVPVNVKADGGVEALRVVAVMELLRDAGVEKLRLLTVSEAP